MARSDISKALKALRVRAGLSVRATADRLDMPASTYAEYERVFKRKYLPMELAEGLARAFASEGIPAAEVLALAGIRPVESINPIAVVDRVKLDGAQSSEAHVDLDQTRLVRPGSWPQALKVIGVASAGDGDSFEMNQGEPIEWVRCPPGLLGATSAFALYVTGSSMSPAFEEGDLIVLHLGRPVTPGCYCVIELHPTHDGENPRAFLKRLVRRGPDKVVVEQYNPAKRLTFNTADIRTLYRVLSMKDVIGL